jgi:Tol biopolymer transport system component
MNEKSPVARHAPQRLTQDSNFISNPRVSARGRLVFASTQSRLNIAGLRVSSSIHVTGEATRLTHEFEFDSRASISADGRFLSWYSQAAGKSDRMLIKDLTTGRTWELPRKHPGAGHHVISPSGSKVAYRVVEGRKQAIYLADAVDSAEARRVCEDCGSPSSWSFDETRIFYQTGGSPGTIGMVDLRTGKWGDVYLHPVYGLHSAKYMNDPKSRGEWLTFHASTGPNTRQVFIAPLREGKIPGPSDWITITDGLAMDLDPCWAPDGSGLFYVSDRDGFRCIRGQKVDPRTKHPVGQPVAVEDFHSATRRLASPAYLRGAVGLSAGGNLLVFAVHEAVANIWAMRLPPQ